MVIFKAITKPFGMELDVEPYIIGKVFESSFQNIKRIIIPSFVDGVMVILVKSCQSAKIGEKQSTESGYQSTGFVVFLAKLTRIHSSQLD